jgi:hypothetical protein
MNEGASKACYVGAPRRLAGFSRTSLARNIYYDSNKLSKRVSCLGFSYSIENDLPREARTGSAIFTADRANTESSCSCACPWPHKQTSSQAMADAYVCVAQTAAMAYVWRAELNVCCMRRACVEIRTAVDPPPYAYAYARTRSHLLNLVYTYIPTGCWRVISRARAAARTSLHGSRSSSRACNLRVRHA